MLQVRWFVLLACMLSQTLQGSLDSKIDDLCKASQRGDRSEMQRLLQNLQVDYIHIHKNDVAIILISACRCPNNLALIKELLTVPVIRENAGASLSYNKCTPLIEACMKESVPVVQELLKLPTVRKSVNERFADNGQTALMIACKNNNVSLVRELLQWPEVIDGINMKNDKGFTALLVACLVDAVEVVHELLQVPEVRNQLDIRDNLGRTALMIACSSKSSRVVRLLLSDPIVRLNINNKHQYGWTALMFASNQNDVSIVQDLLVIPEVTSNVNIRDNDGLTALMHALCSRQMSVVNELLQAPVDITHQDHNFRSCLTILRARSSDPSIDPKEKDYVDEILQVYDIQEPSCSMAEVGEMTVLWEAYTQFQRGNKELIRDVLFKIPFIMKAATKQDFWFDRMQLAVNRMFQNNSDHMRLFMQYVAKDNTQKVLANRYLKACNHEAILLPKVGIFGHDTRKLSERLQEPVCAQCGVVPVVATTIHLEDVD